MTGLRRALAAIGVGAVVFGLALVPVIAMSDFTDLRGLQIGLMLLAGWGFVASGLFAWARRPDSRMGAVMVFTGYAWFVSFILASNAPLLFTLGAALSNLFAAAVIHLLLAFPGGELRTRVDRLVVRTSYVTVTVGLLPALMFSSTSYTDCANCPRNVFLIEDNETVFDTYSAVLNVFGVILLTFVVACLVRRYRAATRPEQRVLLPVYISGGVMLGMLTVALSVSLFSVSDDVAMVIFFVATGSFAVLPYVFLGGLVRARILQAGAMTQLLTRLADRPAPGALRDALARVLRDESLLLAYWLPEQGYWVDAAGQRVDAPVAGGGRAVTPVEREGEPVAAIVYDASIADDRDLLEAIGGAAGLALENERLDAELRARVEELRTSRARLVEAGIAERRRLERNLHDGAQQRLVSLALSMRMARGKVESDPAAAVELLDGAGHELELALAELRELARGIHPAVLSDRGLDAALEALAARAPIPVKLHSNVNGDVPDAVESAAYFVVAEALTNVAKYANADSAAVHLEQSHGFVSVAVSDDGVGGADPDAGTGLRGLGDRLSALDGRLEIDSSRGRGTTVRARIPCE